MLAFFSVRLKQLRTAKNLTQTQVADYAGVSRSAITAYESDIRYPSYEVLVRLSFLFGVSTDYLLDRETTRTLDCKNLTEKEISHIQDLINDIAKYK